MSDRPAVAVGHVSLRVKDVSVAEAFYRKLGLRPIMCRDGMAILELRGGTHLMLFRARGTPRAGPVRSFDFMVDDLPAERDRLRADGIATTAIEPDRLSGHRWLQVTDPDGHVLTVMSSHVDGRDV